MLGIPVLAIRRCGRGRGVLVADHSFFLAEVQRRSRWRRESRRYSPSPGQNLHFGILRGRRPRVSVSVVGMVGGSVEIENSGIRDQSVLLCCTCYTFAHGQGTENLLAHAPQSCSLFKPLSCLWRWSSMTTRESVFVIEELISKTC